MKWFDTWFLKQSIKAWEFMRNQPDNLVADSNIPPYSPHSQLKSLSRSFNMPSTSFRTFNANGGTVVEITYYDVTTDHTNCALHVIPSDKDLGESLAHIITYEALKR